MERMLENECRANNGMHQNVQNEILRQDIMGP